MTKAKTSKALTGAVKAPGRKARQRPRARGSARGRLWPALVGAAAVLLLFGGLLYAIRHAPRGTEGAASGTAKPIAVLNTPDKHSLLFSRSESGVVYFGHHGGLLRSTDGGSSWSVVRGVSGDAMQLNGPVQEPETLYMTGHNVFLVSRDGGQTWVPPLHDLPGTDIHGFAVDPEQPEHLFAFVVGFGLLESGDAGQTWRLLNPAVPGDTMALAYSPGEPDALLIGTMQRGIGRSVDGGQTWQGVGRGVVSSGITALTADPSDPEVIYAGGQGLFVSRDRGETWEALGPFKKFLMAVAVDPRDSNALLVVDEDGRVYRSTDGGQTWGG